MRFLFLILSFTTLLSSTQPLWDLMCKTLVNECGVSLCEGDVCTLQEEEESTENPNRQCCPSFQCCFLAFAGFSTPYTLDFKDIALKKIRPTERADVLHSTFINDCFHPPDVAFFTA